MTSTQAHPEVHELGAAEIATGIAEGELSVVEVAEAYLERVRQYDGALQSFSYMDREGILLDAQKLDDEVKAGQVRGPLHGVPFGIKEQFALKDVPTRGDWKAESPPTATYDATIVARLRDAGALLFGKLYMVGPSGTPPTRNPWNLDHTPGGSSSGSGAAVGARFVPFALSEQTGGSGIRPAAYCGVSGFKPTYGRNSRRGMFQMAWSHDHACLIGLSIADIAKVFAVTSGYDEADPTSLPLPPVNANIDLASMKPPRIGVVRNFFPELTEPDMQAAIETSAQKLAAAGADVVDMELPADFGLAWPMWALVGGAEGATINARTEAEKIRSGEEVVIAPQPGTPASHFAMLSRSLGQLIPASYYLHAQRMRRWLRPIVDSAIGEYDALLMATAPGAAPRGIHSSGDWSLLLPWTHLGNPATSIPGGLSPDGLPLGLQLVGPNLGDEALLATSAWCEEALGRLPVPALVDPRGS